MSHGTKGPGTVVGRQGYNITVSYDGGQKKTYDVRKPHGLSTIPGPPLSQSFKMFRPVGKAWSDEARAAAAESRRRGSAGGGSKNPMRTGSQMEQDEERYRPRGPSDSQMESDRIRQGPGFRRPGQVYKPSSQRESEAQTRANRDADREHARQQRAEAALRTRGRRRPASRETFRPGA